MCRKLIFLSLFILIIGLVGHASGEEKASNPIPANEEKCVESNTYLSWSPGVAASTHDVYFGVNFDDVDNATTASPEFMCNQLITTYNPGVLELCRTYYWRIDEVNGVDIWKGDVWSFTTMCDYCCEILVYKDDIKWSQPPVEVSEGIINGWDEYSSYLDSPIMADDWVCADDRPIKDIHWWGSFKGWNECVLPNDVPSAFHIGIWTDVPDSDPNNQNTFSHPGKLIWEKISDCYVWSCAGRDLDPRGIDGNDTCFKFDQLLSQDEWFYQEPHSSEFDLTAGICDEFNLPTEDAVPSQNMLNYVPWQGAFGRDFDQTGSNNIFGHTFTNLPPNIIAAELEITMQPYTSSDPENDNLALEFDSGAPGWPSVWRRRISQLPLVPGDPSIGQWNTGDNPKTFTLDLGHLPTETGETSILGQLADGELDVIVHDDTVVDCITLRLEYASASVYWLSISAIYNGNTPEYPWGWKTRPHFFNDDAVRILPPVAKCLNDCPDPNLSEFWAGEPDDFNLPAEPTSPDDELRTFIETCTSAGVVLNFDDLDRDTWLGHTFTGLPQCIIAAELEFKARARDGYGPFNDSIGFIDSISGCTKTVVWSSYFGNLPEANGYWDEGEVQTFNLNLANLPAAGGGTVLDHLASGSLRIYVNDDTFIDYMVLRIWSCPLVEQWPPEVGSFWESGEPIEYPSGTSWDLAFVLTTNRAYAPRLGYWPSTPSGSTPSSQLDFNSDLKVDLKDFSVLAGQWLTEGYLWPDQDWP